MKVAPTIKCKGCPERKSYNPSKDGHNRICERKMWEFWLKPKIIERGYIQETLLGIV